MNASRALFGPSSLLPRRARSSANLTFPRARDAHARAGRCAALSREDAEALEYADDLKHWCPPARRRRPARGETGARGGRGAGGVAGAGSRSAGDARGRLADGCSRPEVD